MVDGLLDAVRVLDLSGGVADVVTRLFADLGADVLKVEPPGGCLARDALPTLRGASIPFAVHNANKRSAVLDPFDDEDCARFLDLAADADIVVDTGADERGAMFGTSGEELAARYPHLVVLHHNRHKVDVNRPLDGAVDDPGRGALGLGPMRRERHTCADVISLAPARHEGGGGAQGLPRLHRGGASVVGRHVGLRAPVRHPRPVPSAGHGVWYADNFSVAHSHSSSF